MYQRSGSFNFVSRQKHRPKTRLLLDISLTKQDFLRFANEADLLSGQKNGSVEIGAMLSSMQFLSFQQPGEDEAESYYSTSLHRAVLFWCLITSVNFFFFLLLSLFFFLLFTVNRLSHL